MLPNTPTDSLFKFLAIGGMLLAGSSLWYEKDCNNSLAVSGINVKSQYLEFINEVETVFHKHSFENPKDTRVIPLVLVNTATGSEAQLLPGVDYTFLYAGEKRQSFRKVLSFWNNWLLGQDKEPNPIAYSPASHELRSKLRILSASVEQLWQQYDNAQTTCEVAKVGTYIGIVMSAVGFVFWIRNQRRSDEMERHELQEYRTKYITLITDKENRQRANIHNELGSGI